MRSFVHLAKKRKERKETKERKEKETKGKTKGERKRKERKKEGESTAARKREGEESRQQGEGGEKLHEPPGQPRTTVAVTIVGNAISRQNRPFSLLLNITSKTFFLNDFK